MIDDVHPVRSVQDVVNGDLSFEDKINYLQDLVQPDHTYNVDESFQPVIQLIQLQHALANNTPNIPQLFKEIQHHITNKSDYLSTYIRITYNDLHSDYTYLTHSPTEIIELINKKILLVKSCSFDSLIASLHEKIICLLIVAPYDFRKLPIITYLVQCHLSLAPSVQTIFNLILENKLIPINVFRQFLDLVPGLYGHIFNTFNQELLLTNLLENNIVTLKKYYYSIHFEQIYSIFGLDPDSIDIEQIVANMIIKSKLQENCKIDQVNNLLIFNVEDMIPVSLNDHILQIGSLATEIVNEIR